MSEFTPDQEQESNEPNPEKIGQALKEVFAELAANVTEEDAENFKSRLAESPQWQFVPRDSDKEQTAPIDAEKVEYDLDKNLDEILEQITSSYITELWDEKRDITEIMEDAMTVVDALGGDSNIIIEKLIEIGALE